MNETPSCGWTRPGPFSFRADMTVGEILRAHPLAADVFASFRLANCRECESGETERLDSVCIAYGIPLAELLAALNRLVSPFPPASGG